MIRSDRRKRKWIARGLLGAGVLGVALPVSVARAADTADVIRGDIHVTERTQKSVVGNVTVFKTPGRERRLDFVAVVPARVSDVWPILSTAKGIQSFYAPGADVDLRPGGAFEMYYAPDAPPGQRGMEETVVLSFIPGEMLSGTGSAPPEFPTVRKEKTKWVLLLSEVEGSTRVQMSMIEWPDGGEWDRAFDYLAERNPAFLEALHSRFTQGPVNWTARGVNPAPIKEDYVHPKLWRVDRSISVKSDLETVWNLFTTSEGLVRQGAAVEANVELKFGGLYERFENPTAPEGRRGQEGTRLLAYLPRQMLSYEWLAPPQFPEVRGGPAWETWRFHDLGHGAVRIRYTALGMGNGPQWEDAFNLLDRKMDFVMENLRSLFPK